MSIFRAAETKCRSLRACIGVCGVLWRKVMRSWSIAYRGKDPLAGDLIGGVSTIYGLRVGICRFVVVGGCCVRKCASCVLSNRHVVARPQRCAGSRAIAHRFVVRTVLSAGKEGWTAPVFATYSLRSRRLTKSSIERTSTCATRCAWSRGTTKSRRRRIWSSALATCPCSIRTGLIARRC